MKHYDEETRFDNYWTEVFPVITGLRPASILEVASGNLFFCIEILKKHSLSMKVTTVRALNSRRKELGQDALENYHHENLIYIGGSAETAAALMEYDERNDMVNVGLTMGYPECCVRHLAATGLENIDTAPLAERFPVVTHIPCSTDCRPTIEYQEKLVALIDKYRKNGGRIRRTIP